MKKYISKFPEAKQIGILYHFTSIKNLILIIKNNQLLGAINGISTTRDKFGWKHMTTIAGNQCAIILDGDKISNNYKIFPYQDLSDKYSDEQEERIPVRVIKNIDKYIKKIVLLYPENWRIDYRDILLINRLIGNTENDEEINIDYVIDFISKKFKIEIISKETKRY